MYVNATTSKTKQTETEAGLGLCVNVDNESRRLPHSDDRGMYHTGRELLLPESDATWACQPVTSPDTLTICYRSMVESSLGLENVSPLISPCRNPRET